MQGLKPGKYRRIPETDYRKARRALARHLKLKVLHQEMKKRNTKDPVLRVLINQAIQYTTQL